MLTFSFIFMVVSAITTAILMEEFAINAIWLAIAGLSFYVIMLIKHFREFFKKVCEANGI